MRAFVFGKKLFEGAVGTILNNALRSLRAKAFDGIETKQDLTLFRDRKEGVRRPVYARGLNVDAHAGTFADEHAYFAGVFCFGGEAGRHKRNGVMRFEPCGEVAEKAVGN